MARKFSGKRPVMFYQPGILKDSGSYTLGPRIRIFYPNGKVEWCSIGGPSFTFEEKPCWLYGDRLYSMREAIKRANSYDSARGFPKMQFVDEL